MASYAIATASARATSDDRVAVIERGSSLVVVVADGAGGRAGGARASTAIEKAVRDACAAGGDAFDVRAWSALLREVDGALAKGFVGETTAIVLAVEDDVVAGVSAGDSEAWLVGGDEVERLTSKQGRARIGSGRAVPVPFFARIGKRVLVVASDGLFGQARREAIVAAAATGSVAAMAERLREAPRLASGDHPDDLSVVVIRSTGDVGR